MNVVFVTLALACFVYVEAASEWSYDDPSTWGSHYPSCNGRSQSPIRITKAMTKYSDYLGHFVFKKYDTSMTYTVLNNGHTVQLNIHDNGVTVTGGDLPGTFQAIQFHFHWSRNHIDKGSEHIVDGIACPLELHIVHVNQKYPNVTEALKHPDGLAVLGFLYKIGKMNYALDKFIKNLPQASHNTTSGKFSLSELIDSNHDMHDFYRYAGSLTTPPCSEAVVWTLFKKHLTISQSQLEAFWKVKDSKGKQMMNYRPYQELNNRVVLISFKSSGMMTTALLALVALSVFLSANLW